MAKKNIDDYMRLHCTYTIEEEFAHGKKYYIIRVNELPGICTDAEDLEEGMRGIKEAMRGAFKLYKRLGDEIPVPRGSSRINPAQRSTNKIRCPRLGSWQDRC